MPNNLADWLSYLESLHPKTIELGLDRVEQVRQRLNLNPAFSIVTVGGTNGKGSVCAMLEAMLHAAGYKVGCYTSPHLLDYNERVRIGKKQASDAELCASFEKVEQARKAQFPSPLQGEGQDGGGNVGHHSSQLLPPPQPSPCKGEGASADEISLTYFEFGTLAAMQLFIERKVDVAILEVGLGGRLDAVNIFDSDVAVVTNVGMDHMDYLGDSIEKIAYEKAGIFRKDKVAIFGDSDMSEMIASEAQRIGAELWRLGHEFGFEVMGRALPDMVGKAHPTASNGAGQWRYRGPFGERHALPYPALRGSSQLSNASAALAALDALKEKLLVSMEAVRRGLVEVALPGRFQVLPGRPQIILDVGHNPQAARVLAQNLAALPPAKTYAVLAMLKDKDIAGVVRELKGRIDVWLVAGLEGPRGASAAETAAALAAEGVTAQEFPDVDSAMRHACNEAAENDRIAAFGSFYTVADVMRVCGLRHA